VYRFPDREHVMDELCAFLDDAFARDATPILLAYALGKAQEVAHLVAGRGYALALWSSAHHLLDTYRDAGLAFGDVIELGDDAPSHAGSLRRDRRVLIVPPDRNAGAFVRRFARRRTAFLSGWAMAPELAWRPHTDASFAISDHADFDELLALVERVKPRKVYTLHGPDRFAGELRVRGWDATPAKHARQMTLL
jgi:Cft2 family RNA processing exonuclease